MTDNAPTRTPPPDAGPHGHRPAPGFARHHALALVLVAPVLAALAVDWVVTGVTGTRTFVTDDELGPAWANTLVGVVFAAACAALVVVLLREQPLFGAVTRWGRTLRACRAIVIVGLVGMVAGTVVISPLLAALDIESGALHAASGVLAAAALACMFVPSLVIGLTQLRHHELGLGGRLLSLAVPALVLTALVALTTDGWASPVLLTMTVLGGISVLGAGVRRG